MWPLVQGMHLCFLIVNSNFNAKGGSSFTALPLFILMDIMWPISQSHFHVSCLCSLKFIYLLSFMCDVCNEVHEHM